MTDSSDPELLEAINVLCENLSISRDDITYIKLKNGTELICELCDYEAVDSDFDDEMGHIIDVNDDTHALIQNETHEIVFFPLVINRENFISSDGSFISNKYFDVYNEYNNDIFQPIEKSEISIKSPVTNNMAVLDYLTSVSVHYYSLDLDQQPIESTISPKLGENVIDFDKYFMRRKMKQF